MEFKNRYTEITNKFEILVLEKEIKEFMVSETGKMLPEEEMYSIDVLLIKVMTKRVDTKGRKCLVSIAYYI